MDSNPYASPTPAPALQAGKPESPFFRKVARLSWQLPLGGLLFTVAMNAAFRQIPLMGIVGFLAFAGCAIIGFVMALIALGAAVKYRGVLGHAIGGTITGVLLLVMIVGLFGAVGAARDAARRQRVQQNLQQLEQGIQRYKQEQSTP